jgi:cyclopropane fatty-acyl-phospholipid synthase-like methyltransferase
VRVPGRTNSEQILDLTISVSSLEERVKVMLRDIEELRAFRERVSEILISRVAVLEAQVAELRKQQDENDRRRWMMLLAVIGSVATLVINLVITLLRK